MKPEEFELPEALKTSDIPVMPVAALEVLRLCKNENTGIEDLVAWISKDPALAAKLLQLSNSSMFNPGRVISSLDQAAMLLGLRTVQLMALTFSMANVVPRDGSIGKLKISEYWRRSLTSASAGRVLTDLLKIADKDEAFVTGLLTQIGRLAVARGCKGLYDEVFEKAGGRWPTTEIEREVLGFDSNFVGAALLKSWGLPNRLFLSIAHRMNRDALPPKSEPELYDLTDILHLVSLVETTLEEEHKGEAFEALQTALKERGLNDDDISQFLVDLETAIGEMGAMFDVDLGPRIDHQAIIEEARAQVMRISMGYAANVIELQQKAQDLEEENRHLADQVGQDGLTGIANRKGFTSVFEKSFSEPDDDVNILGLLLIDIDHFKQINDAHGHLAGDEILRTIGGCLKTATRDTDLPARYGGDEFIVLLPQVTPDTLESIAERLHQSIRELDIEFDGAKIPASVSIGGACMEPTNDPAAPEILIKAADEQLYISKRLGKNRLQIAARPVYPTSNSTSTSTATVGATPAVAASTR